MQLFGHHNEVTSLFLSVIIVPATTSRLFAREFGLEASDLPLDRRPAFDVCLLCGPRANGDAGLTWFRALVEEVFSGLVAEARA